MALAAFTKIVKVTRPPQVSDERSRTAVEEIARRRQVVDDPHRELLSDDPLEVLDYLRKYSGSMPDWVKAADVQDGLLLKVHLWWKLESHEAWLLNSSERLKLSRRQVGKILGVTSSQGFVNRLNAKISLFPGLRQVGVTSPVADGTVDKAVEVILAGTDPRLPWLNNHRQELENLGHVLLQVRDKASEDAYEYLAQVQDDLRAGVCSPGSFMQLAFAVHELSGNGDLEDLEADHPALTAMHRVRELHMEWRGLADR